MNRIKRMPIFYPVFAMINFTVAAFVYFPKWLFGAWWCEDCNKLYGTEDEMISAQHGDICKKCYDYEYGGNDMTPYEKEVVYVTRSPEGVITNVYDINRKEYLKVVDTAITIDSSKPEKEVV